MAIDDNYASPGLRWGLLQDDFPGAHATYELVQAHAIPGGHPFSNPNDDFVLCTITFPSGVNKVSAYGWKPLSAALKQTDEQYAALRTKALGRALKDAGYPDNLNDLRALTAWRHRQAEIGAISSGHVAGELTAGTEKELSAALDAAASPEDEAGFDEGDPDVVEAEIVEETSPDATPDAPEEGYNADEHRATLLEVIAGMGSQDQEWLRGKFMEGAISENAAEWTPDQMWQIDEWMNA